ncbi:MAG TPA: 5'-3' exonuclease H3TH domain-containing protein [Patescibacteria group bacterium]|nr:5'-3' exonuclease H3TH domain-containing protein [Patescibacteria group bacterium]
MQKLVLIDGSALLHRAYHAMPGLTNSNGQLINAVYGFFGMFLTILNEQKPDYLVVAFDRSKPTVRQSMFAGYHEHRPPMASELSDQVGLIDELLERLKAQVVSSEGYEGDDVIGTFAHQANKEKDLVTFIVTGDRDILQLVNEKTKVIMLITGMTKTVVFDEALVEEKYGVTPMQFVDYKALLGDPSDGYPGITGIGPKTAANLLQKFGTFEELYKRIDEVPEKIALKLATDAEQGALAKKLATIITDAPVHLDLTACKVENLDLVALREGFAKHNFKSLISRLDARYPELANKKAATSNGQLGLLD